MVCGRVVFVGAVVHVARSASHHATFSVIQAARWRNTLHQITRAAGFVGVAMRDYAIAFGLQNHMCHLRTSKHKKLQTDVAVVWYARTVWQVSFFVDQPSVYS